jgi:hypothetical protein
MTVSRNIHDFSKLICECLKLGWEYSRGQPNEQQLQYWATLGRATSAFKKSHNDSICTKHQVIHLIRCKEEASVLNGYRRLCSIGLWTAWIEDYPVIRPVERTIFSIQP